MCFAGLGVVLVGLALGFDVVWVCGLGVVLFGCYLEISQVVGFLVGLCGVYRLG